MFLKKFFSIVLSLVVVSGLASANVCPKWFPMPALDGLVVVIPIYDASMTGSDMDCDGLLDSVDGDIDGDGLSNTQEVSMGTNPRNADSDGDGVSDGNDALPLNSSETIDTDGDGIGNNADTDDDGDSDSDVSEIAQGSDPLNASSTLDDTYFKITIQTDIQMGKRDKGGNSNTNTFYVSTDPEEDYNYNVDCNNDGINEATGLMEGYTCEYASAGTYTVVIKDNTGLRTGFPHLDFNEHGKLVGLNQWGTMKWTSMQEAFYNCENLNDTGGAATDTPDLSFVTNMSGMFDRAIVFNQDIGDWDTRAVTDMKRMFANARVFNQDIGDWDTCGVTDMSKMFEYAIAFNQDIRDWDTSAVTDMSYMFSGRINMMGNIEATAFNQDIGDWNTSAVVDMHKMFSVSAFNQYIGGWDTSVVRNMYGMFADARAFNQDIGSWDISAVTDMSYIFSGRINRMGNIEATAFNQYIGDWNTSAVISMNEMFSISVFNQDIGDWDTGSVMNMNYMFNGATAFMNHDLSDWNISKVDSRHHTDFMTNVGISNIPPRWPHFIITVKTNNTGDSNDNQFTIPTSGSGYNYNVDCNNNGTDNATDVSGDYTCEYVTEGTYTVVIKDNTGDGTGFPRICFNDDGDKDKIVGINQWGIGKWTSMKWAFYGCINLNAGYSSDGSQVGAAAIDTPDFSNLTSINSMFMHANKFNQDIGDWNTTHVENMGQMFAYASDFNQSIGDWNTSQVTSMSSMFLYASSFDRDIGDWDTSHVTIMYQMFHSATSFNQNLSSWDFKVRSVTNMNSMFTNATTFSQDLSGWDVSADPTHNNFATGSGGVVEPNWHP